MPGPLLQRQLIPAVTSPALQERSPHVSNELTVAQDTVSKQFLIPLDTLWCQTLLRFHPPFTASGTELSTPLHRHPGLYHKQYGQQDQGSDPWTQH